MWFLTFLSYVAVFVQIVFCTLAVATALYYLAELVEEYTTLAKKIIRILNSGVFAIYIMLWLFENFPLTLIIFGIMAQICHLLLLRSFPVFTFVSFDFIGTVFLVIVNHYLAFRYFTAEYYPFFEVITYFTLCLWIVPFALFVSLSANDNVLPSITDDKGNDVSNYFSKRNKGYSLLSFLSYTKDIILPMRTKKGF